MDGVVDLALEIAGGDAEDDRRRQHGDRGEAADHERRADALERLPQHVVADAVGAKRMVAAGHPGQGADGQAEQREGERHGGPWHARRADRHTFFGPPAAPRKAGEQDRDHGQRHGQPAPQAQPEPREDVCPAALVGVFQVDARAAQPGKVAHRLAVDDHGFLGELAHRQGLGIGFLRAGQHGALEQSVERRLDRWRIDRRGIGRRPRRRGKQGPVMHRIEQADRDEGGEDHGRTHGRRIAGDARPRGAQVGAAAHAPRVGRGAQRHEPQRDIGPEEDELGHVGYSNLTRGSASV
ncbi:hypothetical protein D9M68_717390 [compost metagenome]